MVEIILNQLSTKVAEGWNQKDTTYVHLFGNKCPVSLANNEDERLFKTRGRWIYKGVYILTFNDKLYRIVI